MKNSLAKTSFTLLAGAAIGYGASLLLSDKTKKAHAKALKKSATKFKEVLTNPEEQARIKEIFGKKTQQATEQYQEVKDNLAGKLADIRGNIVTIDKQKYLDTLSQVIDEIRQEKKLDTKQLERLKSFLAHDYQIIKQAWNDDSNNNQDESKP